MLSQLAVPIALFCLMLLVPGFLAARALGLSRMLALCCAPIVSIGLVSIVGEAYNVARIPATPATVFIPICVLSLVVLFVTRVKFGTRPEGWEGACQVPVWAPVLFVLIGLVICNSVYLSELDSPETVLQSYDVTHHLNTIQSFFESRRISSIGVNSYLTEQDTLIRPYGVTSTYPSAWYALCALVMQMTPIAVPELINASMAAFTAVVLPLGLLAWASLTFKDNMPAVMATALMGVAFATFPWCMIMFGPLYPNLAGFATLPATSALFMVLTGEYQTTDREVRESKGLRSLILERAPFALLLLCALAGQALLHPNTLFSLLLFFAPYCTLRIYRYCSTTRHMSTPLSLGAAVLFVLFCMAFWVACFFLPAFSDIVGEYWPSFAYHWQEVINILTQTYVLAFFTEITAQVALGILVVIGWICCAYDKESRWLALAYLVVCVVNFVGATSFNPTFKQFFAGFWYTDAMRLAAMACILAALLAARGLAWVFETVLDLVSAYNEKRERATHPYLIAGVLAALFFVINFMPGFNWPGAHSSVSRAEFDELKRADREYETMTVKTTFGDYRQLVSRLNERNTPIDVQEREFLHEVAQIVPDGALIINNPMDGSFLAYGGVGLRIYYREFGYAGGRTESEQSAILRTGLCNIASDPTVRAAVDRIQAEYVLVMNEQNSSSSFINLRGDFSHGEFAGISSITTDTEGFTPLLTNGACTLYKID